jgi:hypothetical protein
MLSNLDQASNGTDGLIAVKSNNSRTLQGRLGALVVGITFALNL